MKSRLDRDGLRRRPSRALLRNQLKRVDVGRAHDGEIATAQRRDGGDAKPLRNRDDRRIHSSDSHIRVALDELDDALIVRSGQIDDDKR